MKSKILLLIAVFAVPNFFATAAEAGWQRYRTSCGYSYRYIQQPAQVVQKTTTQTTVINNLVGIPVPVNYSQPIASQGSTVYGYSAQSAYGTTSLDMALLYNQAARLTDQAQQLAGQAATDFATLVQAEGQNRAEVARIIAQGQSAREALRATTSTAPAPQVQQRTFAFRVTQGEDGKLKVETIKVETKDFQLSGAQGTASNVSDLLKNSCVSCHGNTKSNGNLNLEVKISDVQQAAILTRVTTDDLDKRMPRNPDGTAGHKLNVSELKLLFKAMGDQK